MRQPFSGHHRGSAGGIRALQSCLCKCSKVLGVTGGGVEGRGEVSVEISTAHKQDNTPGSHDCVYSDGSFRGALSRSAAPRVRSQETHDTQHHVILPRERQGAFVPGAFWRRRAHP